MPTAITQDICSDVKEYSTDLFALFNAYFEENSHQLDTHLCNVLFIANEQTFYNNVEHHDDCFTYVDMAASMWHLVSPTCLDSDFLKKSHDLIVKLNSMKEEYKKEIHA